METINQRKAINRLARITGASKKQVIKTLKQMSKMPEVKAEIARINNKQD